jgi:membrane protein DedA with SNARE-associated domain
MHEWITNIITSLGYWGIGLLMFLENLFPPIPSELIMPLAGFTVAKGDMQIFPVMVAGVVGTVLGALPWYYAGKLLGEERLRKLANSYSKWLGITGKDIDKSTAWFEKHGNNAVLMGRMVPGVRTLISIPAGISDMDILPFVLYSTIGTTLWVGFLTATGYFLGNNYERVDEYLAPVSKIVLVTLAIAFGLFVWKKKRLKDM